MLRWRSQNTEVGCYRLVIKQFNSKDIALLEKELDKLYNRVDVAMRKVKEGGTFFMAPEKIRASNWRNSLVRALEFEHSSKVYHASMNYMKHMKGG